MLVLAWLFPDNFLKHEITYHLGRYHGVALNPDDADVGIAADTASSWLRYLSTVGGEPPWGLAAGSTVEGQLSSGFNHQEQGRWSRAIRIVVLPLEPKVFPRPVVAPLRPPWLTPVTMHPWLGLPPDGTVEGVGPTTDG